MTELLCHNDGYLKEFDARVVESTEKGVVLDRTTFYPGGGGQPCDTGILRSGDREWKVTKLSRVDGKLVHELEGEGMPDQGDAAHGAIHWERRYQLMRTHTALHILCGVVWRDYGAQVTGGNMEPLAARMDFELERMSADFAHEVEDIINREVAAARDVEAKVLPRDEALQIPDLIRTKVNLLPPDITEIRVIDIKGLDLQADGGIHVRNTSEIGRIRVVKHESKGKINKRLRIAVE